MFSPETSEPRGSFAGPVVSRPRSDSGVTIRSDYSDATR
jgi:hypothetical protein